MENSIEEDMKILEEFKTHRYAMLLIKYEDRNKTNLKIEQAIEHILSDYKRVLKENESLQKTYDDCYCKYKHYKQFESISVQKVKDKIEEINKAYEDSKDENGESQYYYPDYTIRVLEELLESE